MTKNLIASSRETSLAIWLEQDYGQMNGHQQNLGGLQRSPESSRAPIGPGAAVARIVIPGSSGGLLSSLELSGDHPSFDDSGYQAPFNREFTYQNFTCNDKLLLL